MSAANLFHMEREGDAFILTPLVDLSELEYDEAVMQGIYAAIQDETIQRLVLDFHRTDYFGSTALGFFVRLWKKMKTRGGCMTFCNVSAHEREILRITRLDELWPLCASREEALRVRP